jgi:tetratricopeptide (TPR) repeat protein
MKLASVRRSLIGSRAALTLLAALLAGAGPLALASTTRTAVQAPTDSEPEATSLFGVALRPTPPTGEAADRLHANLAAADAAYREAPTADNLIWLGRRTAYLGRYREAIALFSKGIAQFPEDPRFFRHRGHRYITVRRFDAARADLERAGALVRRAPDEVEPDGQPNARNIPTSTLHFNVWYHLGLVLYLEGRFDAARTAYARCLDASRNPDAQVATRHWLYMTIRRQQNIVDAATTLEPVTESMDVIENLSYKRLLLMYRGTLAPDALLDEAANALDRATVTYGVANWHLYNGRRAEAVTLMKAIVHGPQWAAFGSIAAEADLKRLGEQP